MVNQQYKKIFALVGFVVVSACFNWACSINSKQKEEQRYYSHIQKLVGFDIREVEKVEESFHENPSLEMGYRLMDVFAHYKPAKNYDKVIFYGLKCVELGADNSCYGLDVSFLLAVAYYKVGNNKEAHKYVQKALLFDTNKEIEKFNLFEREGVDKELLLQKQRSQF